MEKDMEMIPIAKESDNLIFTIIANSNAGKTYKEILIATNLERVGRKPQKKHALFKSMKYLLYETYNGYQIRFILRRLVKLGLICKKYKKYTLSDVSKNILSLKKPHKIGKENMEMLLTWSYDIGDKQYRSYSWNDAKVQSLLTVDGALLAGIIIIFQIVNESGNIKIEGIPLLLYALSFVLLSFSLIYCLQHSIPRLNSKIGNEGNLRTIIGINRFHIMEQALGRKNFNAREKYYETIVGLGIEDLLRMNVTQIAGMSKNNNTSHRIIRKGVIFTIISVVLILIGTIWLSAQTSLAKEIINSIFNIFGR